MLLFALVYLQHPAQLTAFYLACTHSALHLPSTQENQVCVFAIDESVHVDHSLFLLLLLCITHRVESHGISTPHHANRLHQLPTDLLSLSLQIASFINSSPIYYRTMTTPFWMAWELVTSALMVVAVVFMMYLAVSLQPSRIPVERRWVGVGQQCERILDLMMLCAVL